MLGNDILNKSILKFNFFFRKKTRAHFTRDEIFLLFLTII
jgi:hypothetical protein